MERFVVRVWLPDRPGALGAVASRVGAVGGDVVGIEILERGAGQAIDEIVVEMASDEHIDLLVGEIGQVDGASVEEIRPATERGHDPRLDGLEAAAGLVAARDRRSLATVLVDAVGWIFDADWAALMGPDDAEVLAATGPVDAGWLRAFVAGVGSGGRPDDVAHATARGLTVVCAREAVAFRDRERRELHVIAAIAGDRWAQLGC